MNYDKCLGELERMLKHAREVLEACREDVDAQGIVEKFEVRVAALDFALELVRYVAAAMAPATKPEKWRVVHTATDEEMRLAVSLGREPRGFSVIWRKATPGQDFSREAADALGAAYIAATGDHRVRIEEVEE